MAVVWPNSGANALTLTDEAEISRRCWGTARYLNWLIVVNYLVCTSDRNKLSLMACMKVVFISWFYLNYSVS